MISNIVAYLDDLVWGPWLLILLVGVGIYLSCSLRFIQFRYLFYGLKLAFFKKSQNSKKEGVKGDISHFQSLMTALAATIGTGNIVGVATAISLGGAGSLFWMWITALFGMATKYAEAVLAVKYRITDEDGNMVGGPMYYISRGLGYKKLAYCFALFGTVAALGIGNMTQSNSVCGSLEGSFGVSPYISAFILMVFTALTLIGGIKSIAKTTGVIVPIMTVFYIGSGLLILVLNIDKLPYAIETIFSSAFSLKAGISGLIGSVIRYGVSRGIFSNEAGLGSAPIAAAAAITDHPSRQAVVSMIGTFLDTIVVCTITGIIIVMCMDENPNIDVSVSFLTSYSFSYFLSNVGGIIVSVSLMFFAYSTILGWCYYGEKCAYYIFGKKSIMYYKILFSIFVFIGGVTKLDIVWSISDALNGAMAVPNIIGLILLSKVVVNETKGFQEILKKEQITK